MRSLSLPARFELERSRARGHDHDQLMPTSTSTFAELNKLLYFCVYEISLAKQDQRPPRANEGAQQPKSVREGACG